MGTCSFVHYFDSHLFIGGVADPLVDIAVGTLPQDLVHVNFVAFNFFDGTHHFVYFINAEK